MKMKLDANNLPKDLLYKKIRVFVNGKDVTNRCKSFDSDAGVAELYEVDKDGRFVSGMDLHTILLQVRGDVTYLIE